MEFASVYHKTSEQMSYALDENQLVVNIKTGYDVKKIFIHYGDPFDAGILGGNEKWTGKREEIVYKKRLSHQIWWTTTLLPVYKRCKYYFELHTEKEVWYYFEDGFGFGVSATMRILVLVPIRKYPSHFGHTYPCAFTSSRQDHHPRYLILHLFGRMLPV